MYFDIYYDDVNKSRRTNLNTNISLVYISVANLNYKFRSKRNSIGLVAAAKRFTVDALTHARFFDPIATEINSLTPIIVNGYSLYLKFFSVKADNKASHEMIVDIPQGFNSDSCRRCKIRYEQLKNVRTHEPRSLPVNHVFAICTYFSTNLYSFCWFHDLCEGVIEKLMGCILKNETPAYLEELSSKLQSTSKEIYKKNKLSSFKLFKSEGKLALKGTGIQKLNFFFLFSIVSDKFADHPQSNEFKLYFLLRKIINFCLADEVYREDLIHLKSLSGKFIDLFIETYREESVVFKMHYLEHYDEIIEEFSLLMLSSTLVYERVNQKVIRSTEGSRNYVDLALQMFNNFTFKVEDYFKLDVLQEHQNLNQVEDIYRSFISRSTNEPIQRIQECQLIIYENMKVKLLNFYMIGHTNNENNFPVFICVQKIFFINNSIPIIIGRLYAACEYSMTHLIYKFKRMRDVIGIHPNQIIYHKKMLTFNSNENSFIVDNFYVKNDTSYLSIDVNSTRV